MAPDINIFVKFSLQLTTLNCDLSSSSTMQWTHQCVKGETFWQREDIVVRRNFTWLPLQLHAVGGAVALWIVRSSLALDRVVWVRAPCREHFAVFLGKTLYSHNAGEVSVQGTRSCNCPGFQCHAVRNQNLSLDKVQNLEKERRPI